MSENYNWRPNDNSSSTRLKYDLEAEHWVKSVDSAKQKLASERRANEVTLNVIFALFRYFFTACLWVAKLIITGVVALFRKIASNRKSNQTEKVSQAGDKVYSRRPKFLDA